MDIVQLSNKINYLQKELSKLKFQMQCVICNGGGGGSVVFEDSDSILWSGDGTLSSPYIATAVGGAGQISSFTVSGVTGTSITDARLTNRTVTGFIIDNSANNADFSKPLASNTITFLNGTQGFNSTITILFE